MTVRIDPEFQALIPPLTAEEYTGLELNICEYGCRVPLDVWGDLLVDGHNRLSICQKHNIPYEIKQIDFPDRHAAMLWIIRNQLDRRNIPLYERGRLELLKATYLEQQAKENILKAQETSSKRGGKAFQNSEKPMSRVHVAKEVSKASGISTDTLSRIKKLEAKAPAPIKAKLRAGNISINEAYKQVKREEQKEKRKQTALALETATQQIPSLDDLPQKYRVIYADPPWTYGNEYTQAMPGSTRPEDHYPAMPTHEICDLPIKAISLQDAVLFLWVPSPLLPDGLQVCHAWGFTYKTSFVWDKIKHNFGHYNSVRHEFLLVCTRGSCTPDVKTLYDSVQSIERTEHSEKPEKFREIIDELYQYGARLELFARTLSKNWDTWGNELC